MAGNFRWQDGFIAVDWGTTNRRAWAAEPGGGTRELLEDGMGVLKVAPGGYTGEVDRLRALWPGRPLLLAGMVGSNRGWVDAGYVPAPADLDAVVGSSVTLDNTSTPFFANATMLSTRFLVVVSLG